MTHMIEGYIDAFFTRLFTSAASANPLGRNLDPVQRGRTINLLTFTALKHNDEMREEESLVDRQGRLKDFRTFVTQLVKRDEAAQSAELIARGDPRLINPPGAENQSSSPSLGL